MPKGRVAETGGRVYRYRVKLRRAVVQEVDTWFTLPDEDPLAARDLAIQAAEDPLPWRDTEEYDLYAIEPDDIERVE